MILAPGTLIRDWAGSEGSLAVMLRSSTDPSGVYFLSAAHVMASAWIDKGACAASNCCLSNPPSGPGISQGLISTQPGSAFGLGSPDVKALGSVVKQTCLKSFNLTNNCDAAIAKIQNRDSWDILATPPTKEQYLLLEDEDLLSQAVASQLAIVRFGGKTDLAKGTLTGTVDAPSVPLDGKPISLVYSSLVTYTSTPTPKPGDSGSLISVVRSTDSSGSKLQIVPFALHIGILDGTPVCCPIDPFLSKTEFKIAYEPPPGA